MNDFIYEKDGFLNTKEAEDFLSKVKNTNLNLIKTHYNIHGSNLECHNLQRYEELKDLIFNINIKVESELMSYFYSYDVQPLKQSFIGASLLLLKDNESIPKHTDEVFDNGTIRNVGILIYLNEVSGGQLLFPLQKKIVKPEAGKLVIFPASFTHPHLVMNTVGDRYALRFNYGIQI